MTSASRRAPATVRRTAAAGAALLLGAATLCGCGSSAPAAGHVAPAHPAHPSVAAAAAAAASGGGHAALGDLSVAGAYIPDPATPSMASAYFTVTSRGAADRLLSVSTSEFASATLHHYRTSPDGGETMVPATDGAVVPAHGRLVLQPGGYHVMLMQPRRAITKGQRVMVSLRFARAGRVDVAVPVVADTGLPADS